MNSARVPSFSQVKDQGVLGSVMWRSGPWSLGRLGLNGLSGCSSGTLGGLKPKAPCTTLFTPPAPPLHPSSSFHFLRGFQQFRPSAPSNMPGPGPEGSCPKFPGDQFPSPPSNLYYKCYFLKVVPFPGLANQVRSPVNPFYSSLRSPHPPPCRRHSSVCGRQVSVQDCLSFSSTR